MYDLNNNNIHNLTFTSKKTEEMVEKIKYIESFISLNINIHLSENEDKLIELIEKRVDILTKLNSLLISCNQFNNHLLKTLSKYKNILDDITNVKNYIEKYNNEYESINEE